MAELVAPHLDAVGVRLPPARAYASFPWYDLPEMHESSNAFWEALAGALRARGVDDVPAALDRSLPYGVDWNGKCLFTQTCGYPLFTTSLGHFAVVGIPCYAAAGCDGFLHRSFIVVHRASRFRTLEDLRGTRFAVNEADSNSGMNLPRRLFAPRNREGRFFASTVVTGSHAASAELVTAHGADAAALDCVTFALLRRYRPNAVGDLRIIAQTATSPAPPFATSQRTSAAALTAIREALSEIARNPQYAQLRAALFLSDVAMADDRAYAVVVEYEREAQLLGYPVLA
jgi:ABC-type phosphate/phosphonate transport system substrate-binding protein